MNPILLAAATTPIPAINAGLNFIATVLLTVGFILILKKKKEAHKKAMISAFIVSAIFLVGYVTDKIIRQGVHTPFAGEGLWRAVYYTMLITHVILAIAIVPLIFRTFFLSFKQRFDEHRQIARWTFPLWYYVSVTGVLIYFFLYHWFPGA
jgi:putative membrane protein